MIAVDDIATGLAQRNVQLTDPGPDGGHAAVAVILHEPTPGDVRLLIIERARHPGDPWSGDLAFPGGRVDPDDSDERAAAQRETMEEVGLDLSTARLLGRLDDLSARVLPLSVSAFVYSLDSATDLTPSDEVFAAFWVPVAHIVDENRHCHHLRQDGDNPGRYPAIDLFGPGKPLLWGVTYHFVYAMLREAGHELPTAIASSGGTSP